MTGEDYVIGFKSGQRITVNVTDGKEFVDAICETVSKARGGQVSWHIDSSRTILNLNEVEFVFPAKALVDVNKVGRNPIR